MTMLIDLHNDQHMLLLVSALFVLFLVYFLAYFKLPWQKISPRRVFIALFALYLPFLFVPFISSNDLYSYISATRINGIFGQNPYFVQYDSFQHDVLYRELETIWAHHPTLYGPLFLHIGGFLNWVGQNNLVFLTLAFKSLFIGANLVNAFLVYQISKSQKALFLFAANPLVVFELSGNSHTESLTLLFFLSSIYFLYRRPVLGFAGFTASVLVKYYSALFVPFYLIKLKKEGLKTLLYSLFLGVLLTVAAYWQFWRGLENFDYLLAYYNGQYVNPSLLIYLGEKLLGSYVLSFQINTLVFLSFAGVLFYKFLKSKVELKEFTFSCFLLYWAYVLTKSSLILPWYIIMLVALASLCMVWREYQKYALASLVFVAIYSLGLYYFVR